jgi:hypothetical protein
MGVSYSWFSSTYEFTYNYLIPSKGIVVLTFDAPVASNITGALYPAEVTTDAIAKNNWADADYIVKPRGEVTYNSSFTYYAGDPQLVGIIESEFSASIAPDSSNKRNLISSGELHIIAEYSIRGVIIKYDSLLGYFVKGDDQSFVSLSGKAAYILDNSVGTIASTNYIEPNGAFTLICDDRLFIPAQVSVPVSVVAALIYPAGLTAYDLDNTTVNIELALSLYKGDGL